MAVSPLPDEGGRARARVRSRAALAVLVALAAAGCGGGGGSTPTIKPQPSPTEDPQVAVIIKAYLDAVKADIAAKSIPDPNYPALLATTIDPDLSRARSIIQYEVRIGTVARGGPNDQHHPHVTSIAGTVATVQDCFYSTAIYVFQSTGQPDPDQPGGTQPTWVDIRMTLQETSPGVWKDADSQTFLGSCPPGFS